MRTVRISLLGLAAAALVLVPALGAQASNDPAFSNQWSLARIGAEKAWTRTTGPGVKIGIVDTGVDLTHEDLTGKGDESISCVGSGGELAKCQGSAQDDQAHGPPEHGN